MEVVSIIECKELGETAGCENRITQCCGSPIDDGCPEICRACREFTGGELECGCKVIPGGY